jgi:hypothetical protein
VRLFYLPKEGKKRQNHGWMLEKKCKVVSLFGVEVGDEVLDGH